MRHSLKAQQDARLRRQYIRNLRAANAALMYRVPQGGSTGGSSQIIWYTAANKASLPSGVASTALGRVTDGTVYIRNSANDAWVALNKWE